MAPPATRLHLKWSTGPVPVQRYRTKPLEGGTRGAVAQAAARTGPSWDGGRSGAGTGDGERGRDGGRRALNSDGRSRRLKPSPGPGAGPQVVTAAASPARAACPGDASAGAAAERDGATVQPLLGLLPLPLVRLVVVGAAEHGVEDEERDQQVRQVYRQQRQALARRLRSRVLRLGEVVEQDVRQDGKQSRGYVGGVDNRRRPYPFAATCIGAKRKQYFSVFVWNKQNSVAFKLP